jgi:HSP20 family molecular chaperone IbpA
MWAEACALVEQAERRHRHFFELLSAPAPQPAWEPPVNVLLAGGELLIVVALPGADAADIEVQVVPGGLQVDARVAPLALAARTSVLRLEIPYGIMRRRIDLPSGSYRLVEHRFSNGCLHLRLQEAVR